MKLSLQIPKPGMWDVVWGEVLGFVQGARRHFALRGPGAKCEDQPGQGARAQRAQARPAAWAAVLPGAPFSPASEPQTPTRDEEAPLGPTGVLPA